LIKQHDNVELAEMAATEHHAAMSLDQLLRPSSVAIIGASPRSFMGSVALSNLESLSFPGPVTVVNPKYNEVRGYPAVPNVAEIETRVDVAVVQIAAERVARSIEESVAAGIHNFIVPGAGFTDSGEVATALVADLKAMRRSDGIRVVGPNTMGVVDLVTGAAPYVGTVPGSLRRGSIAVVSQSGAVCEAFVNSGGRIPMSTAISTGSEATVDLSDYLDYFAADAATSAILAFVEGVRQPDRLLASLGRLEKAGKRIAMLIVGKSEVARTGIVLHSGRLAPDYRVARAALAQAGAVVVDDLDELMAVGELFAAGINSIGNRAALVVNSGGEGNLLADLAADNGVDLPALSVVAANRLNATWPRFRAGNPLDPWGVADYREVYPTAMNVAAAEDVDVVIVSQDQQTTCGEYEQQLGLDLAQYLHDACREHNRAGVFLSPTAQEPPTQLSDQCRRDGIALLRGGAPGLRAIGRLAGRGWSLKSAGDPTSPPAAMLEFEGVVGVLAEAEALQVLHRSDIATPRRTAVATREEALRAAAEIGYPVVVKGTGAAIAHKTELGLVHAGIGGKQQLEAALDDLTAKGNDLGINMGYLVAEHVGGDLELLVGFHRDATFGPTVVVGLGGIWAEALDVVAVRIGEVGPVLAHQMLDECGVGRMLHDARGGPLAIDAVIETICSISKIGLEHPSITAIEVNPVIVSRERAVAVDCLITVEPQPPNVKGKQQ
jgi:acyl-CoA synthetase (NDP forming)